MRSIYQYTPGWGSVGGTLSKLHRTVPVPAHRQHNTRHKANVRQIERKMVSETKERRAQDSHRFSFSQNPLLLLLVVNLLSSILTLSIFCVLACAHSTSTPVFALLYRGAVRSRRGPVRSCPVRSGPVRSTPVQHTRSYLVLYYSTYTVTVQLAPGTSSRTPVQTIVDKTRPGHIADICV